jgi:hypothetical protein
MSLRVKQHFASLMGTIAHQCGAVERCVAALRPAPTPTPRARRASPRFENGGGRSPSLPLLAVGAYGQYAFAALASDAKAAFPGGKGRDIRVGVEATYALASTGSVAPWFGLGAGWEWAQVSWIESGVDATSGFDGPEAKLQGGADWKVSEALAVGPFVSLTVGQFRSLSAKGGGREITVEINSSEREIHEWLQVGLRGRFDL